MNPDTMTLTELRDWHAREDGWTPLTADGWLAPNREPWGAVIHAHPFPATLDGAAAAMPEGWEWQRRRGYPTPQGSPLFWEAFIWEPKHHKVYANDTGDEITDRYRLAMKAKLAEKESKHV